MRFSSVQFALRNSLFLMVLSPVATVTLAQESQGFEFDIATWHVADTSIDAGGDWSATSFTIGGGYDFLADRDRTLGIGLKLGQQEHDFSPSFEPWDSVQQAELAFVWRQTLSDRWSVLATPSVGLSMESGADTSDALQYGTILAFNQFVNPSLQWGFGFGYFGGLEDNTGFPLLLIRWKINEQWSLGNPFSAGPVGPAGLELGYQVNEKWSLSGGSAYRTERFALDDGGPNANRYGETEGALLFLRSVYRAGSGELHLLAGILVNGELQIDDSNGNKVFASDIDPAPIAAISWQGRF